MKWITSTLLNQWADSREAQGLMPELVLRLIRATTSDVSELHFPSGEAVCLTGWDGILESSHQVYTIEAGLSLWECGTTKNVRTKAESDYTKRLKDPLGYSPDMATYVFVTPRMWNKAKDWERNKNAANQWKRVIVLTAVELEDWLSLCPVVALWLAELIHHHPIKATTIDTYWKKWAVGPKITLNPDILLGGREAEQKKLYQYLQKPSVCVIKSMSQVESEAFAVACLIHSNDYLKWSSQSLVVYDEETLDRLIDEYNDLIFITNVRIKNDYYAIQKGHKIIYAVSAAEVTNINNHINLPLIDRDKFVNSLISSGIKRVNAEQLSKETVRNITILRRRLEFDSNSPQWTKPEHIRDLIPAILVGRWDDRKEGDRTLIAYLTNETYEQYSGKLQRWVNSDDAPLVTIDGRWRIISPYEAFLYASHYITKSDFEKFQFAINKVSADIDPDAMPKLVATSFDFWEDKQRYTEWLKKGIFQSVILISILAKSTKLCTPQQPSNVWVDDIIDRILNQSTIEWWFSNRSIIGLIAEASPQCYVNFIAEDIKHKNSIIKRLFIPKGKTSFLGPGENYIEVLWSLQMLLWEEDLLLPISEILMELSTIKNNCNSLDKPIEVLRMAYTIWYPQTYVATTQRLDALGVLFRKYKTQTFTLCKELIRGLDRGVVFPTHAMHWRRFGQEYRKVTYNDITLSIDQICNMLIENCDYSDSQVLDILDLAAQLYIGVYNREKLFNSIFQRRNQFIGNYTICNKLRQTIHYHKSLPDADWALDSAEISKWEKLLQDIESKDPIQKYRWMFKDDYFGMLYENRKLHAPSEIYTNAVETQELAVKEIFSYKGLDGVIEFAQIVECPYAVGESYARICVDSDIDNIVCLVQNESKSLIQFAKGFFGGYCVLNGTNKLISLFKSLNREKYSDQLLIALSMVGFSKDIFDFIETFPVKQQIQYWQQVSCTFNDKCDNTYVITKLNSVQRYCESIDVIYRSLHDNICISSDIIIDTILRLMFSMSQVNRCQLADVILELDKRDDADVKKLYLIELVYYALIDSHKHLRLIDEIMFNPQSLMDILNLMYLSSDPKEKESELEWIDKNNIFHKIYVESAFRLLFNLRRTPCVNDAYEIDEVALKKYIVELRGLASEAHKLQQVDITIGELLANYPEEIDNYPPSAICEIIEDINSKEINIGFRTRIINKLGVTIRPASQGGKLEQKESSKYKRYADKVRFSYPIIANIFDSISREYSTMSAQEDTRTLIKKMEF